MRDRGIAGDGATLASAGLQRVMSELEGVGGGAVAPAGVYLLDSTVAFRYGTGLAGVGRTMVDSQSQTLKGTVLRAASAMPVMVDLSGISGSNDTQAEFVWLHDLVIDGANLATVGVKIFNARRVILERVHIKRCVHGLLLGRDTGKDVAYQLTFRDVVITHCTNGVSTVGSAKHADCLFDNCEVRYCSGDFVGNWDATGGLAAADGQGALIRGTFLRGFIGGGRAPNGIGLHVTDPAQLLVMGTELENSGFAGAESLRIDGNDVGTVQLLNVNPSTTGKGTGRTSGIHVLGGGAVVVEGCRVRAKAGVDAPDFVGVRIGPNVPADALRIGPNDFRGFVEGMTEVLVS